MGRDKKVGVHGTDAERSGKPAKGGGNGQPSVCPVTRSKFAREAKPLTLRVGDEVLTLDVKQFSTGSLGWTYNGKLQIPVGDVMCKVQAGLNLTIVGSKELPNSDD